MIARCARVILEQEGNDVGIDYDPAHGTASGDAPP
jgi:hypothetical protein